MFNIWKLFSRERQDNNRIPAEYQFAHELSYFLHDILVQIIKSGEGAAIFANSRHKITNPEDIKAIQALSGEKLWEWLEKNNYQYVIDDINLKQPTVALLSDYCHSSCEALNCSRKHKLTVTYALLRKPFKDNLFYIEWLLVDRPEFLKSFKNGLTEPTPELRRCIGERAVELLPVPGLFDPALIYDLRYKKSAEIGFEGNWNQANHLITTCRSFKTETQNFNFIFSGEDAHVTQWRFLYTRLPYLLNYAVEVVELLLENIERTDPAYVKTMRLRRMAGLTIWAQGLNPIHCGWDLDVFRKRMSECLTVQCPKCAQICALELSHMGELYEMGNVRCASCGKVSVLPLHSK